MKRPITYWRQYIPGILTSLVLVASVMLPFAGQSAAQTPPSEAVQAGRTVLSSLAQQDTDEVDRIFQAHQEQHLAGSRSAQNRAQLIEDIRNDRVDIWSVFQDCVVLGDSRALGFSHYQFLRTEQVLASGGNTIRDIPKHMDEVKILDPAYIYLCYGINDVGRQGVWQTGESHAAEMVQRVTELQQLCPHATMVVSSTILPTPKAVRLNTSWQILPEFDSAMKEACERSGILYCDNDALCDQYMDTLWMGDGVHLRKDFYPLWAKNLLLTALEG